MAAVAALAPAIAAADTRVYGLLTAEYAEREISHHDSIFYELWSNGWERLRPGKEACWDGQPGGAEAFFEGVRRGTTCSANWFSAAKGDLAAADARARFTGHAPALLGFDPDIYDYCSDLNGQSHSFTGNDWQAEFSLRCIRANRNVLRVQQGWTMCKNFEWVLCAARGWLPGMWTRELEFAVIPSRMDLAKHRAPSSCINGPCTSHFAVDNVYFAEVIVLSSVCANAKELYAYRQGGRFACEFDEARYRRLALALRSRGAQALAAGCVDTPAWSSPTGLTCADYARRRYCSEASAPAEQHWALGEYHGWPERHCCACGKE